MQKYEIKFQLKSAHGTLGNMMVQVVSAWGPTQAIEQVKAMYGGANKVQIFLWKPI
jgi:hypothetical protein